MDLCGCTVRVALETTWGWNAHPLGLEGGHPWCASSLMGPNSAWTIAFSPSFYQTPWHMSGLKAHEASSWKDPYPSILQHMQHNMEALWWSPCARHSSQWASYKPCGEGRCLSASVFRMDQTESIIMHTDDMSPMGVPNLWITQPIPTLSMSWMCRSGRKARSMAVVWLQQWGASLSGLNDPSVM